MNDLKMGFNQTMLHNVTAMGNHKTCLSPSEKPSNSSEESSQLSQVTDFSIKRILSENNGKSYKFLNRKHQIVRNKSPPIVLKTTNLLSRISVLSSPETSDILDLSKTSVDSSQVETFTHQTTSYNQTTQSDFLAANAAANATKIYAHLFPHMYSSYVSPNQYLITPQTSPNQRRYFAPYIVNSSNSPTTRLSPPAMTLSSQSETFCFHSNCLKCLNYLKIPPCKSAPVLSYGASSICLTSTNIFKTKSSSPLLLNSYSFRNASTTNCKSTKISSIDLAAALDSEEVSYKCRICDKVFGCSQTLQGHERTHKSPRYECTDCGKGFSQLRNYKYHLSVHRGTKEFAAECSECGKTFNDKGYLSSHMKIHRNKKEYECPFCPKSFNQRVAFNMHVRIHTGVKPHKCTECGKRFSRKMLLKQHMRTHSGEKPYQCSVCGKSFADRSNMTLHHRLHSGIKPFSCPICPKAFTKKHHLKTHLNYHTGCKPYVCPHINCSQAFTQSSNMRTHSKKCQYKPLQLPFPSVTTLNIATHTTRQTSDTSSPSSLSHVPALLSAVSTDYSPFHPANLSADIQMLSSSSSIPPDQQSLFSAL